MSGRKCVGNGVVVRIRCWKCVCREVCVASC